MTMVSGDVTGRIAIVEHDNGGFKIYLMPLDETDLLPHAEVSVTTDRPIVPYTMTMDYIEIQNEVYLKKGLGSFLFDLAVSEARQRHARLMPSPDLSDDGFHLWFRKDPQALAEVLSSPALPLHADYWGVDMDKITNQITFLRENF